MSSHAVVNAYEAKIRDIITRKKAAIIQQAHLRGKKKAERAAATFIAHLQSASKKVLDTKIDCLIKTAHVIVSQHLTSNPHLIIPMVIKLLRNVAEHTDVELCAHPIDAAIIRANIHEIFAQAGSARKICVVEDDTFARGSILLKANKSIIDAHIATQLEKARELIASRAELFHG